MALDLIVCVIGILFMIRRTNVRRREPSMYKEIKSEDFLAWRALEQSGYALCSLACMLYVVADFLVQFLYVDRPGADVRVFVPLGFGTFIAWVVAMVVGLLRGRRGKLLREQLGIDIFRPIPDDR